MDITKIINEELNKIVQSFKNLENDYPDYYEELISKYSEEAKRLEREFPAQNNIDEDIVRYKIRGKFLRVENNEDRCYFTISSKIDFSDLPSGEINSDWGKSLLFSPLNDHSRKFMKKGDVVFCYRQGQFADLNIALDIRGIYGIGIVASDPKEIFEDLKNHERWAIEVCFPLQLQNHLNLRNIQLHPTTIDLTPYNGNRNDALQYIPKKNHYETLLNLIYSANIGLKDYFVQILPDHIFKKIELPEAVWSNEFNTHNSIPSKFHNPLVDAFIGWANKPGNYQKSYKGSFYYPILKSWDSIFFDDQIFMLDSKNLEESFEKIQATILDKNNIEWAEFSVGTGNGAPGAILGKKNYLRFLRHIIDNAVENENIINLVDKSNFDKKQSISIEGEIANEKSIIPKNPIYNEPRNQITYGAPGTGKSYSLKTKIEGDEGLFPHEWLRNRITFHPNYSYRNFVGSYKPVPLYKETDSVIYSSDAVTENKMHQKEPIIEYQFEPGPFLEMFIKAIKNPDYNFVILIEEINRANTAAVFGDVFQLLDRNEEGESVYSITLEPSAQDFLRANNISNPSIKIPKNLYIWATMNNADQGVMPLDSAFKRRWSFNHIGLNENEEQVNGYDINLPYLSKTRLRLSWNEFRRTINSKLLSEGIHEDKLIGPFFLSGNEIVNTDAVRNKLLLYLKEDVLRYKSCVFDGKFKSFSDISNAFKNGNNVFSGDLEFKFEDVKIVSGENIEVK